MVVGVAVASILGRDGVPPVPFDGVAQSSVLVSRGGPTANRSGKTDRLPVGSAIDSLRLSQPDDLNAPLRQAFATDSPVGAVGPTQLPPIVIPSQPPSRPKLVAKPGQKNYAVLSDAQIVAIKGRLNLTAAQEQHWHGVETALRAVARKIQDARLANPAASSPPIDPASAEVQQLKSAAMPLLVQLREEQKREVRSLARIIGLESVASVI